MPAFGDNPNVACYMDDLYVYLRARANDAVGRVRPAKHEARPTLSPRPKAVAWKVTANGPTAMDSRIEACLTVVRSETGD